MRASWKKREDGLTYYAHVTDTEVVCGEHGDNPHGVNDETRCSHADFVQRTAAGQRCRQIIAEDFGQAVVQAIDAVIERGN